MAEYDDFHEGSGGSGRKKDRDIERQDGLRFNKDAPNPSKPGMPQHTILSNGHSDWSQTAIARDIRGAKDRLVGGVKTHVLSTEKGLARPFRHPVKFSEDVKVELEKAQAKRRLEAPAKRQVEKEKAEIDYLKRGGDRRTIVIREKTQPRYNYPDPIQQQYDAADRIMSRETYTPSILNPAPSPLDIRRGGARGIVGFLDVARTSQPSARARASAKAQARSNVNVYIGKNGKVRVSDAQEHQQVVDSRPPVLRMLDFFDNNNNQMPPEQARRLQRAGRKYPASQSNLESMAKSYTDFFFGGS